MKLAALLTGLTFVLPLAVFGASISTGSSIDIYPRYEDGDASGYAGLHVRVPDDIHRRTEDGDASGYTGLRVRVPGDVQDIKARLPILVPLAATIAEGVVNVVAFILDQINQDNLVSTTTRVIPI